MTRLTDEQLRELLAQRTKSDWWSIPCSHGGELVVRPSCPQEMMQIVPTADAQLFASSARLAAEVLELRKALESIEAVATEYSVAPMAGTKAMRMCEIARAALRGES